MSNEGIVKFFDKIKNYGFITSEDKDYFVHITAVKNGGTITQGDKVSFEPTQGDRGLKAIEVEKI